MASRNQSITEARREQAFSDPGSPPRLSACGASARFGHTSREKFCLKAAKVSEGLTVILSGKVDVARHALSGNGALIVTHVAGGVPGELAQLAGRPALVDAKRKPRSMPW
jgi:hypothetical protein